MSIRIMAESNRYIQSIFLSLPNLSLTTDRINKARTGQLNKRIMWLSGILVPQWNSTMKSQFGNNPDMTLVVGSLLEFYILETPRVISG